MFVKGETQQEQNRANKLPWPKTSRMREGGRNFIREDEARGFPVENKRVILNFQGNSKLFLTTFFIRIFVRQKAV